MLIIESEPFSMRDVSRFLTQFQGHFESLLISQKIPNRHWQKEIR